MKKIGVIIVLLLSVFMYIPNVYAVSVDEFINADDDLRLEKNIDGTGFTFGNNVELNNKFNGISFVAGNNIKDSSKSDYSFIAGNNIDLINVDTKDLFVAGNMVRIDSNKIERDIYVAASSITISGNIGRNAYITGETVKINGNINGNLTISASNIEISDGVKISDTLKYNDDAKISNINKSNIGNIETYKGEDVSTTNSLKDDIFSRLTLFVNILVIGVIMLFLFKKLFIRIDKEDINASNIIKNILIGLCLLVVIPVCVIILLISTFGIALSLILLALYMITIYLSNIFTGYYISKKLLSDRVKNDYLILGVGLIVLYVLRFIPVIGGISIVFSLFYGMGLFIKTLVQIINENKTLNIK